MCSQHVRRYRIHARQTYRCCWYWLSYADGGKPVILCFGLVSDVAVNSIIGILTLRQWGGSLDFITSEFSSCLLHKIIAIHYELMKQGLCHTIKFLSSGFVKPLQRTVNNVTFLFSNIDSTSTVSSSSNLIPVSNINSPTKCDTPIGDCFRRKKLAQLNTNDNHRAYIRLDCST